MAESGKAHAWKACSPTGFWVQIPVLALEEVTVTLYRHPRAASTHSPAATDE